MEATRQKDATKSGQETLLVRRILPEVVEESWDLVRYAIATGVPLEHQGPATEARVKKALISGLLQAYLILSVGERKALLGIAVVQPTVNFLTGEKTLHIFGLHTAKGLTLAQHREAFKWLRRIALDLGCGTITAITDRPELIRIVEMLGGDCTTTLIQFSTGD